MDQVAYDSLTDAQKRVLRLVDHNRKTEIIAELVGLSPHTVDRHILRARDKIETRMGRRPSRYEAADLVREFEAITQHSGMPSPGISSILDDDPHLAVPEAIPPGPDLVREAPASIDFDDWGVAEPAKTETRYDRDHGRRIALMLGSAAGLAIIALVVLAVAEALTRMIRAAPILPPQ